MSTLLTANPWSWVEMPPGVNLSIADPSGELAGTFMVEGLLAGAAEDYLERFEASRDNADAQVSQSASLFRLGLASLAWLTAVVEESSAKAGRFKIVELRKLGLSLGVTGVVEGIVESWRGVSRGTVAFLSALTRALVLSEDLGAAISSALGARAATPVMLGRELELLRLFLQIAAMAQRQGLASPSRPELFEHQRQFFASGDLRALLGPDVAAVAQALATEAAAFLATPERHDASLLRRGNELSQRVLRLLERGRDEST